MIRRLWLAAPMLLVAACGSPGSTSGAPPDSTVGPGESVQAAVAAAEPGDRILIEPGVYREAITIDKAGVELVGLGGPPGSGAVVIENPGGEANGITVTDAGDGVQISNLTIRNFDENGVLLLQVAGFVLADLVTENDGEYGLFPVLSSDGVIERCIASGHRDTGIYVGQSAHVVIRDSRASGNVNGFEVENSSRVDVLGNQATDNAAGILVVLLPGLAVKTAAGITVAGNTVRENN